MAEKTKHVWLEAPALLQDHADADKAINELLWQQTLEQKRAYGARCAQLARERALAECGGCKRVVEEGEKRIADRDAEISRLKENLNTINNGYHSTIDDVTKLKAALAEANRLVAFHTDDADKAHAELKCVEAKLAEAQAKAVQPDDIVFRVDGRPRVPKDEYVSINSGDICRVTFFDDTEPRTVFKRVQ